MFGQANVLNYTKLSIKFEVDQISKFNKLLPTEAITSVKTR